MSKRNIPSRKNKFTVTQSAFFHRSGPLPPPGEIEQYEKIIPNAAERIFTVFEKQSKHRQEIELRIVKNDCRNSMLGMVFGFIIGMTGITCGAFLIYAGHGSWGAAISGACLTGLVGTFIYGTERRKKEREDKAKMQQFLAK
ncbi:MAG: DUF2335 domain-containing protein [Pseudomonadota bacterium]